jgi:hypothetical protein
MDLVFDFVSSSAVIDRLSRDRTQNTDSKNSSNEFLAFLIAYAVIAATCVLFGSMCSSESVPDSDSE